jgi:hypothetical protein
MNGQKKQVTTTKKITTNINITKEEQHFIFQATP